MTTPGQWEPLKELLTVQKRMNKLFDSALGMTDFDTQEGVDTWVPVCDAFTVRGLERAGKLPDDLRGLLRIHRLLD